MNKIEREQLLEKIRRSNDLPCEAGDMHLFWTRFGGQGFEDARAPKKPHGGWLNWNRLGEVVSQFFVKLL